MVLKNIKAKQGSRGFTIVELLVVIVVIGILAAITIVSYTGITAKANTAKAQSNANAVQAVAEAMNADNGFYPAKVVDTLANYGLTGGSASSHLQAGIAIPDNAGGTVITATNGLTNVAYSCLTTCTNSTGGRIAYWDFQAAADKYIYVGAGTAAGTYAAPAN